MIELILKCSTVTTVLLESPCHHASICQDRSKSKLCAPLRTKEYDSHEEPLSEFNFILVPCVRLAPISPVHDRHMGMSLIMAPDALVPEDGVDVC